MVGIKQHQHDWEIAAVSAVIRKDRVTGEQIALAKLLCRCGTCGETRQELYEGTPEALPQPALPDEIRALHEQSSDTERTIQT